MEKRFKRITFDDTRILFILKGMLVGLFAGLVVSFFRLGIETLSKKIQFFYQQSQQTPSILIGLFLFSLVAAFLVGQLIKHEPAIKGSGIPQVEGQLQGELTYNWFSVLWKKMVGGIFSVGSGLFLGREGPSIQLGAAVGQGTSQLFHSSSSEEKILISSGASAGLAAAFNAPVAGLLFVIEEVHHSFSPLVWLTSFTSAIVANAVSLYFFGLKPVLYLGALPSLPFHYYGALIILGIILGLLGFIYQKTLLALPRFYKRVPLPEYYHGLIPFLLVLPIGYLWPTILGGGNQIVVQLGQLTPPLQGIILLLIIRFVFSMISYGGSLPGGIFLPILTLGALIGSLYGKLLVLYFGMDPVFVKDFVVIAMAGYFTAIGKAPLTAIILVTEMVGSLNHLMPLGVASLVAYIVNDLLGGHPIYESLLERLVDNQPKQSSGKKTTFDFPVTAESQLDGMMVRDFNWPKNMLLISIYRGKKELITHGDTVMKVGDILVILTDESNMASIKKEIQLKSS
ncbi:ClC family H(+)/Cl(-) exchange transporter [Enterococcus thailandicus]